MMLVGGRPASWDTEGRAALAAEAKQAEAPAPTVEADVADPVVDPVQAAVVDGVVLPVDPIVEPLAPQDLNELLAL